MWNSHQPAANHAHAAPAATLAPGSFAVLSLSMAIGTAYPWLAPTLPPAAAIAAKGAGVALLALAAALQRAPQGVWLVAIMLAGATGDVLLELPGLFFVGAGAFAIGHVIAMVFYFPNRRADAGLLARVAALALIGWGLVMPTLVSPPGTPVGLLMLYSVLLCGMAATLLLSRFGRLATAGALLFVVSDTLLIMRLGGRLVGDADLHGLLVWLTYYFGQAMITIGVLRGLPR
jgi:uncharacterized membrane protein YhhN